MCATGPPQHGGGSPPVPLLSSALCTLWPALAWGSRPGLSAQRAPPTSALSCPQGLTTQGQHAVTGSGLPARSWQGCQGPLKAQGLPPLPSLSKAGRVGFPCPAWLLQARGCWAALGCTPSPIADSTVKSNHSSPKLLLSSSAQPGKGDLSLLPQACKHRSHTRSRAPAARKSWPQGSLKEAAPGTDSRPGPRSLQGRIVASSHPPPLRPAPVCRERKHTFNQH